MLLKIDFIWKEVAWVLKCGREVRGNGEIAW